jgi:hypothetical protein
VLSQSSNKIKKPMPAKSAEVSVGLLKKWDYGNTVRRLSAFLNTGGYGNTVNLQRIVRTCYDFTCDSALQIVEHAPWAGGGGYSEKVMQENWNNYNSQHVIYK